MNLHEDRRNGQRENCGTLGVPSKNTPYKVGIYWVYPLLKGSLQGLNSQGYHHFSCEIAFQVLSQVRGVEGGVEGEKTDQVTWIEVMLNLEDHPRTCKWLVTPIYTPWSLATWKRYHTLLIGDLRSPLTNWDDPPRNPLCWMNSLWKFTRFAWNFVVVHLVLQTSPRTN